MAEHANADARPNPKAPTKATLVDAGLHLMLEKGYHHTGIQEVLQAAGVPKGSFYYYFEQRGVWARGDRAVCGGLCGTSRAVVGGDHPESPHPPAPPSRRDADPF